MIERPVRHLFPPADVAIGLVGAMILVPFELWSLRAGGPTIWVVTISVVMTSGLLLGVVIGATSTLAGVARLGPWPRAAVHASASLAATVPVARHLFDGAFASTLPGAALAPVWVPLVALGLLTLALRVGLVAATHVKTRALTGALLLAGAIGIEWINRNVKRSELPDVHTMLVFATIVAAGLSMRLLLPRRAWPRDPDPYVALGRLLTAATLTAFVVSLRFGLTTSSTRMAVTTGGLHTRLLVRLYRATLDLDRDGYASVLGGGDCDEFDATISPGVAEVPGNEIDENCDGRTSEDAAVRRFTAARAEHKADLGRFNERPDVARLLARTRDMNVVLVAIDTLRADVLADEASNRSDFPNLFALLDSGRHFRRTFAPSAGTDLSMSGVLTGQIDPFATEQPTLAEGMRERGRATFAVIPSEVIRYVGKAMLTRGLDHHERLVNDLHERDVGSYLTGSRTLELGMRFVDAHRGEHGERPFFVWLHFFDVHEHHEVKLAALRDRFGDLGDLDRRGRYRMLVRAVDDQIGALEAGLRERGLTDNTIVVLVSDHGEGLGEDPRLPENHGKYVYNALVHVPLVIRVPGLPPGVVDHPVSLLDVYPTLFELIGGPAPDVDGESLLAHLFADASQELVSGVRPLPLNETDQYGVVLWPHKLLVRREDDLVELYDLANDFAERDDLSAKMPEQVDALRAAYAALSGVEIDRTSRGRRARERIAAAGADE